MRGLAVRDVLLADRLDELLRAARTGLPIDPKQFEEGIEDPEDRRLIDFFAQVAQTATEWQNPDCSAENAAFSRKDALLEAPNVDVPEAKLEVPSLEVPSLGRYRLLSLVASGGMGMVYRALDPTLGRTVAVKVPHLDLGHPQFEEIADRFVQEARLTAAVEHPNICPIYDAGRDKRMPYAVMAFIEGPTLAAKLAAGSRFEDTRAAATLVRQVAEGVSAAHRQKIVHRDIKPGNILIRVSDSMPLLTDFGLARIVQEGGQLTRAGVVAGTIAYMAPEQAAGKTALIGPETDVYALGAVLYQMVTGRLPYEGDSATMLACIRDATVPPDPTAHRPDLDPRLVAIIHRAMATAPQDRYSDAGELATALATLPGVSESTTATYVPPPRPVTKRSRSKWLLVAGVLAVVAVVAGWLLRPDRSALPLLDGELTIRVWTDPRANDPNVRRKDGIPVDDKQRDALPIRNIDLVHLEVRLNRPAFAYLLWFPAEGGLPTPLYPWDPHPKKGFRAPPEQKLVTEIHSPERKDGGWPVSGPSGLETAVLLARDHPLDADELAALQAEIGILPATPLGPDVREVAWLWREPTRPDAWLSRGTLRGIQTEESRDLLDEPVFALLKRLQPRFGLVKAVRFAHAGDDLPGRPPLDQNKE